MLIYAYTKTPTGLAPERRREPDLKVLLPSGEGFRVRVIGMLFICLLLKSQNN
jgi:hypothetical protein